MAFLFTPKEMMVKGLLLIPSYDVSRIKKLCQNTKLKDFKHWYGATPEVSSAIWKDLQTCDNVSNRINPRKARVEYFFMSLHFLRKYPTGEEQAKLFNINRETVSTWTWFFLEKIAVLESQKIVWPKEWEKERYAAARKKGKDQQDVYAVSFGCSVDGTHGRIHEPSVGEPQSKNPIYFSHKSHGPAFAYEFAIDIFQDRLVWMNGPFPASTPDREIFKNGLMKMIPDGMRVVADSGYSGEKLKHIISGPNPRDSKKLRKFKSRARSRQEDFNARLKNYKICAETFRHDRYRKKRHKASWTAVAIICQYRIEHEKTFWSV
ncbi:hypothetical protein FisN_UnNu085 [Fistulifera solaris]|uniref:DDE Tnp4 domain-containing protein n=1 Tax=Fistulifera solaris TaxID=1519565 RepID=A0A1Z5JV80_FISSO|nr:hypothetical protein FisN_UnNu085 [Fistulifera solaris]|eukprot:GAX17651.1 hypothetical protein FisN_UnNu085 [Fistulifera solaris]